METSNPRNRRKDVVLTMDKNELMKQRFFNDGRLWDSQIEHMYDDLFFDKNLDGVFFGNIISYGKMYLGLPDVCEDDLHSICGVYEWVMPYYSISVWGIRDEELPEWQEHYPDNGIPDRRYAAKIGPEAVGVPVFASTHYRAVLLSLVQAMRDIVNVRHRSLGVANVC